MTDPFCRAPVARLIPLLLLLAGTLAGCIDGPDPDEEPVPSLAAIGPSDIPSGSTWVVVEVEKNWTGTGGVRLKTQWTAHEAPPGDLDAMQTPEPAQCILAALKRPGDPADHVMGIIPTDSTAVTTPAMGTVLSLNMSTSGGSLDAAFLLPDGPSVSHFLFAHSLLDDEGAIRQLAVTPDRDQPVKMRIVAHGTADCRAGEAAFDEGTFFQAGRAAYADDARRRADFQGHGLLGVAVGFGASYRVTVADDQGVQWQERQTPFSSSLASIESFVTTPGSTWTVEVDDYAATGGGHGMAVLSIDGLPIAFD